MKDDEIRTNAKFYQKSEVGAAATGKEGGGGPIYHRSSSKKE